MKTKKLMLIALFATFLLSASYLSIAAAQDTNDASTSSPLIAPAPDATDTPDSSEPYTGDNTTTTDGEPIYHILDENTTSPNEELVPGAADATLLSAQAETADNTMLIVIGATVGVAAILGAVGMVYYRRQAAKTPT
jgi:hypothetical protein